MIKKYNQFIVESIINNKLTFQKNINKICKKYDIENWTINNDGSIDVDGSVYLNHITLIELPLKFGKVSGDFYCDNSNLTSLLGSPREVGGNFDCHDNELTSLEGSPKFVGHAFYCHYNKLTSLEGAPDKIGSDFLCTYNRLINFKYLPLANGYVFFGNPIDEFLKYLNDYVDKRNLGEYLRLFEDIVQFPYLDDLEFEELAKTLKVQLPEDWRDSVKSYKMLSEF